MAQLDFENLLKNAMGLDTASIGRAATERAVRQRMAALGIERTPDYWQELRDSKGELQQLIEAVVVPETWFFRDPEAFAALAHLADEEWRPAHATGVLRVLSVPCSTGEEPYSIVMSLLDGGFSPQQLQVDAVDISAQALAKATQGVYGSNSFRGGHSASLERYFQPAGHDYVLASEVRSCVSFRQRNLLDPDFSFRKEPYDVIFCRNLLIYFDRHTQEQVMKTLARLLTPSGFLFVGSAEAFLASNSGFTSVNHSMSFAFRKTGNSVVRLDLSLGESKKPLKRQPGPRSPQVTPAQLLPAPTLVPPKTPSLDTSLDPLLNPSLKPSLSLEAARRLADAGRLEEATAWCESNLRQHGPSPQTYYLLGLLRDAVGDRNGAGAFYRKVVYLEPDHVEALMHLALLSETHGDIAAAGRLRERARRVERKGQEKAS